MKSFGRVCAVVVTYNRKNLLPRCLEALRNQVRKPDSIIIVDNASDDGTSDLLFEESYISKLPPLSSTDNLVLLNDKYIPVEAAIKEYSSLQKFDTSSGIDIIYLRMSSNTGGAGGFYEGQKMAFDLGFEWIWMMDDDGFPSHHCLETLVTHADDNMLQALNPLVINCDDNNMLSFGLSAQVKTVSEANVAGGNAGTIFGVANPFNGTLISAKLVSKVGFIKKEMFIWGDETEYFLRLSKHGFKFATVVPAKFYHPESKTTYKSTLWGALSIAGKPDKLEMNYYRNLVYIASRYFLRGAALNVLKSMLYYLLSGDLRKVAKIFLYGLDGLLDRFNLKNVQD